MIASLALTAWAVAAALLAPRILKLSPGRIARPRRALRSWLGLFGSGVVALGVAAVVSIAGGVAATVAPASAGGFEWILSAVAVINAWLVLALVGAVIALVHTRLEPLALGAAAERSAFAALLESAEVATWLYRRVPVSVIAVDAATAFTLPGRNPRIIVSSGLLDLLEVDAVDAVIAHEYAHLRGHHALVRRIAQLNKACLPSLAAATEFERATRLLIELIADDAASAEGRRAELRDALRAIGAVTGDESMTLRARRLRAPGA